jgi:hypothetical protein
MLYLPHLSVTTSPKSRINRYQSSTLSQCHKQAIRDPHKWRPARDYPGLGSSCCCRGRASALLLFRATAPTGFPASRCPWPSADLPRSLETRGKETKEQQKDHLVKSRSHYSLALRFDNRGMKLTEERIIVEATPALRSITHRHHCGGKGSKGFQVGRAF